MTEVKKSDPVESKSGMRDYGMLALNRGLSFVRIAPLVILLAVQARCDAQHANPHCLTQPRVAKGETFGNVFSKTTSYRGNGIDDQSHTIGGTALYEILNSAPANIRVHTSIRYDGKSAGEGDVEVRDSGSSNCSPTQNKCAAARDSSGPFYNVFLWGAPKGELKKGLQWSVELHDPWELGPSGTETVTVLRMDESAGQVTLRRDGQGSGFFCGEESLITLKKDGKPCTFAVTPGRTHWSGISVFAHGVTISDEVLETRELMLSSKDCGSAMVEERQFTVLVKAPSDLL
jgi:hypothetical protein